MMRKIKISVIIPIYNVEKYIEECLLSVINQSLDSIEIILINDGTTDNSILKIEKYIKENKNIHLYNQENSGLSAARNLGISKASGTYIYFLDSDDYIDKDALKTLYDIAISDDLEAVFFEGRTFSDDNQNSLDSLKYNYVRKYNYNEIYDGLEILNLLIKKGDYFPSVCLVLISRDVLVKFNLTFMNGIIHEDELFMFHLLCNMKKLKVVKKVLFNRRVRIGSITTNPKFEKYLDNLLVIVNEIDQYKYEENSIRIQDSKSAIINRLLNNVLYLIYNVSLVKKVDIDLIKNVKKVIIKYRKKFKITFILFYISPNSYIYFRRLYDNFRKLCFSNL